MKQIKNKKGTYQHYKNKEFYEVLEVALHTETKEMLVIYKPLYKSEYKLFARPYKMFFVKVKNPETGKMFPRFSLKKKAVKK